MTFNKWLDTLVDEKGLDTEMIYEVEGASGTNFIPLGCVIEAIKTTTKGEQIAIRNNLIRIDFCNGNISNYFKHLAQAIAI